MASKHDLAILRQGVAAWNRWRRDNPRGRPSLSGADLSAANLSKVNLSRVNLSKVNLNRAGLSHARLSGANLGWADLSGADLSAADLSAAELIGAELSEASLLGANLSDASFLMATLVETDLTGANLSGASFEGANLTAAHLSEACLSGASLVYANLTDAKLKATRIDRATLEGAIFVGVDLSETKGLDSVVHEGPSHLGVDTLYLSRGKIPEVFLRGCGVPENLITYMHSLARKTFEFYSCFISHSSKDRQFAERLHADLQSKGVRCWFAPEDLKIGDRLPRTIGETIHKYDKVLLILSAQSVGSAWVEREVRWALDKEKKEKRTVLFPVRIDDAVMETTAQWAHDIRRDRHIGDFRKWKNHDEYQKAFERLLRDLQAGDKGGKRE